MYEITELFLYKFVFIIEILIAMHLFSFRRKKRNHFVLRLVGGTLACLGLGAIYPIAFYTPLYSSSMFFVLFFICTLSLWFVYDIPFRVVFYLSILAYTVQHFAHEVYALLANSFGFVISSSMGLYGDAAIDLSKVENGAIVVALIYVEVYLLCYWVLYKIFAKKINQEDIRISNFSIMIFTSLILLVEIVLNSFTLYMPEGYNKGYTILLALYNMICCILILYLQISFCLAKNMEQKLEVTSILLHQAEEQYKQKEENVNLMNLKCHDLKHQINRYAKDKKLPDEYIQELEDIVTIYDAPVKTGNEALDLILTEKNLWCQMHGINLTCFADCSQLAFVSVTDIYSLFGNIIDNAVEAVSKLDEKEKKIINIVVRNVNSFVSIQVENYYKGQITFNKKGLPMTTKEDENYHGYGLNSVYMIVQKYDGDIKIDTANGIFSLSIFFPLQNMEKV